MFDQAYANADTDATPAAKASRMMGMAAMPGMPQQGPAGDASAYRPPVYSDQEELDEEFDDLPRRRFLGRGLHAAAGLAGVATMLSGVGRLATGHSGLVQQAQGGEIAVASDSTTVIPERLARPRGFAPVSAQDRHEWHAYRTRFISADGRVIDTGNNGISHTEGQGWGMLFAVCFDDQETFERILGWTSRTLRRPSDALHSWRYSPNAARPVSDLNNATDGDLFIAWALWRAAYRWDRPDYAMAARAISRDILRLLVRKVGDRLVLLPAAYGFEGNDSVTVNPSYYCFPALEELAEALPSPIWAQLRHDGLATIAEGRFGQWHLPPDWLSVSYSDASLSPAPGWPARFSYDAVRIPLYLAWARLTPPPVHRAFQLFWAKPDAIPAWVDLRDGGIASYAAPPGMTAVAKMSTSAANIPLSVDFPPIKASTDYYSAALTLLGRLAGQETRRAA